MRKYNGVYKIPIKKHTKVRRPKSIYHTIIISPREWLTQSFGVEPIVKDISIGLENPLFAGVYEHAKPSLLTRVKERFGRDK